MRSNIRGPAPAVVAHIEAAAAARNLPPGFSSQAEYSIAVHMVEAAAASVASTAVREAPGEQPEVRGSRELLSVHEATADAIRSALLRATRAEEEAERHATEKNELREERGRALAAAAEAKAENAKLRASMFALDKDGPSATPSHDEAVQWLFKHQRSQPSTAPAESSGLGNRDEPSDASARAVNVELAACRAELGAVRGDRDRARAELQEALVAKGEVRLEHELERLRARAERERERE